MAKIKLQNEAIRQRQQQVDADKQAFSASIENDVQKAAQRAEIQSQGNRSREANARRKSERMENREGDAGKPAGDVGRITRDTKRGSRGSERATRGKRGVIRGVASTPASARKANEDSAQALSDAGISPKDAPETGATKGEADPVTWETGEAALGTGYNKEVTGQVGWDADAAQATWDDAAQATWDDAAGATWDQPAEEIRRSRGRGRGRGRSAARRDRGTNGEVENLFMHNLT